MPDDVRSIDNMEIWNSVAKTDPEYTTAVSLRHKFTSVDAMYTLQRATSLFGPVGKGWGYTVEYTTEAVTVPASEKRPGGEALLQFADVTLWWVEPGGSVKRGYGPVRGCNLLCNPNGHIDEDAPKKAMTDALTKGLSHLGFSADVFLGMFDDNKYVAQVRQEFAACKQAPEDLIPPSIRSCVEAMRKLTTIAEVNDHSRLNGPAYNKEPQPIRDWIRVQYDTHRQTLARQNAGREST